MNLWKNTLWNILGLVIPTIIALPAMALMARLLGVERFGLFMLAFALLGYASIFDGGITRAVIRSVAINQTSLDRVRDVMGTALWAVLFLSLVASALTYWGAETIVTLLNVSPAVVPDAVSAFVICALVIPPTIISMTLFSYLEGTQQFGRLNVYKTVTGSLVAAFPAAILFFEATLTNALTGLLIARIANVILAYSACTKDLGFRFFSFSPRLLRELFSFGGWVTLSNIISPMMVYFDRFILSNLLGAGRVAFYTAPAEAIARMSVIPGALARTIFPLFSGDQRNSSNIALHAYKGLTAATAAVVIPVLIFPAPLLDLWLGAPYGQESANILRILAIGFIFNSLAQVPFARIQAHGQARLTALIHLAELLPYLFLITLLVYQWGVHGAAVAWTLRVTVDFIALEFFSRKLGD